MPQKYLASIWLTIIVEIKTKVGYIKPVWNSVDFSTWSTYNYSNNITVDYGYVKNLVSDNVSYPVLITIAADPTVKQKMNVTCFFTVGQDSDIIEFIITPVGTNVSSFCWKFFGVFPFWHCRITLFPICFIVRIQVTTSLLSLLSLVSCTTPLYFLELSLAWNIKLLFLLLQDKSHWI